MDLSLALLQLFPSANSETDWQLRDDGTGQYIAQWNRVEKQPSQAELDQAWIDYQADETKKQATLTTLETRATSAIGVSLTTLTQTQKDALLALLLWSADGVDKDGAVKPLADWVK